jgi:hypothetical protein
LLSGTPPTTAGSEVNFSVAVADSDKGTTTNNYTLQVDPGLVISPTTLNVVTVGNEFSTQLTAAGGSGSGYTFAGGIMPTWMKLSSGGLLSGMPTSMIGSPVHFTVTVADSKGGTGTRLYSLSVNPALVIRPNSLQVATVGDNYKIQLTASGGSHQGYTFSASGLPEGIMLSSSGLLSGMPTATVGLPTTVTVTVTVADSNNATGSHEFDLTVDPALLITPNTLGIASVGDIFQTQLSALGGSGTGYTFKGISLPSWLTVSPSGLLRGTPPTTSGSEVNFSVAVTDSDKGTVGSSYTLHVDPGLVISPTTLNVVTVGNTFSTQLTAAGGSGSGYTFTENGMPPWMNLSSDGLLSGMPTSTSGSPLHFTVTVTDSNNATGSQTYILKVNTQPMPNHTTLAVATVGDPFTSQLTATGGSGSGYTFSSINLPSWLILSSSGLLNGTPTSSATSQQSFTVTVTDSNSATGNGTFEVTVDPALTISPNALGTATAGESFHTQFSASGGSGNGYTFKGVNLPSWLTISANGLLKGTPPATASSEITFSVKATDSEKGTVIVTYQLHINPELVINPTLPAATVGVSYSTQLEASGGSGSGYTFAAVSLPSWLTLSTSGLLTSKETPTEPSHFVLRVTVTDSEGDTNTVDLLLNVQSSGHA